MGASIGPNPAGCAIDWILRPSIDGRVNEVNCASIFGRSIDRSLACSVASINRSIDSDASGGERVSSNQCAAPSHPTLHTTQPQLSHARTHTHSTNSQQQHGVPGGAGRGAVGRGGRGRLHRRALPARGEGEWQ